MPVNVDPLISQINAKIESTTLSDLELLQLSAASSAITNAVSQVDTISDLPDPSKNTGRMIYVADLWDYRYSNGETWSKVYNSTLVGAGSNQLLAWGLNTYCVITQAGNKASPVSVIGGFTDWCQVSAGIQNASAIRTNGTLWTWGRNNFGQLGDCTVTTRSSPVSVVGGFTDWCQASTGNTHIAAVRTNGTLWTWGQNNYGKLGNNSAVTATSSPVSVAGGFTDWCQVSAGFYHTIALRVNQTIWTWGRNHFGQLGDGTVTARSSPVSVVGGFTDWCQVSAGGLHTAAIRTNGTLWTWGSNCTQISCNGQLGDNTTIPKSSPVSVVGGFTDWCQVSAGQWHSAAIRTNGTIWTWGYNSSGQLGDNTTIPKSSPVSVVGGFTDWCQVSAGQWHSAAIRTNGTIWTWGFNSQCQLGNGGYTHKSSPVSVVGGITDWGEVSVANATFAIRTNWKGFNSV